MRANNLSRSAVSASGRAGDGLNRILPIGNAPTGNLGLGALPADVSGLSRARSLQLSDRRGLDPPAAMCGAPAAEADLSDHRGLVFLVAPAADRAGGAGCRGRGYR